MKYDELIWQLNEHIWILGHLRRRKFDQILSLKPPVNFPMKCRLRVQNIHEIDESIEVVPWWTRKKTWHVVNQKWWQVLADCNCHLWSHLWFSIWASSIGNGHWKIEGYRMTKGSSSNFCSGIWSKCKIGPKWKIANEHKPEMMQKVMMHLNISKFSMPSGNIHARLKIPGGPSWIFLLICFFPIWSKYTIFDLVVTDRI